MEWLQPLENGLTVAVGLLKFLLEAISALCVALGLVSTLRLAASRLPHELGFSALRLRFGSWLALALEFQLGADIVGTTVALLRGPGQAGHAGGGEDVLELLPAARAGGGAEAGRCACGLSRGLRSSARGLAP